MNAHRTRTVRVTLPKPHEQTGQVARWRFASLGDLVTLDAPRADREITVSVRQGLAPRVEAMVFLAPSLAREIGAGFLAAAVHAEGGER
ncbi:hypothetical protein [Prauserella muralis]|uniref:Uncharacterized protein n=1 Tax=Prauserella muralis TaxID=588067 RepID=A0A2V4B8U2_9PSEU|nr:hypothetical protein [Prauserella muralis]PXY31688.1 hypothetical protein BAY60_04820 [Prauserella muralis]TWE13935.1 hypothetical protein FHX69_6068 [Prauserella muralis]